MENNYQKFVLLGCRIGYIVRSQIGNGNIEIPDGVLISSDDYILRDFNGIYLIANEESGRKKMLSSDHYILLDRNKRYLLPKESL